MLRRQLLAFGLDRWTRRPPAPRPAAQREVLLARQQSDEFPENFLAYYVAQRARLIDDFLGQYGAALTAENQALLRDYAAETACRRPCARRCARNTKSGKSGAPSCVACAATTEEVGREPSQFQDPAERTRAELQREIKLLLDLVPAVDEQYILNFLADAGLLPNYAFPETGVKLRTIISGFPEARDDGHFYDVHEYVRGAAVAIGELAPFNTFYAESRKVVVDHVEIPRPRQGAGTLAVLRPVRPPGIDPDQPLQPDLPGLWLARLVGPGPTTCDGAHAPDGGLLRPLRQPAGR